MGDLIENLITLVLWIVASYYLRSKRNRAEPQPKPKPKDQQGPVAAKSRRTERDPLEESARRKPKYPSSLDDVSEAEFQVWESRLLQFAEESGMIEDDDGWEVPWSGYRYYDFDELFELYVHREGKPLVPPAKLVLVEGPSGEQVPVLVPNDEEPEALAEAGATEVVRPVAVDTAPSSEEENQSEEIAAAPVINLPSPADYRPSLSSSETKAAGMASPRSKRARKLSTENRQALVAGLILSEAGVFRRRQRSRL